ncbi:MAG TPA: tRNA (adenosine(37)-N6)-threonylcarbamoyltransferase complex ATPase subunit type 1 TsaE [Planctomycetota bacterium]|nr:tRNA (adenosine(37)-N6)-threonylcarbamoyltransferase complex ATPase subunit type 1 TsaE [Planctomycetota bacterium]
MGPGDVPGSSKAPLELLTRSPAETEALGERLGRLLAGGEVIALTGPLGAGKTAFVRGLARGLGCPPGEVASPTYVLERVYPGRLLLRHLDAYRLSGAEEFEASDLGAGLGGPGSAAAVEWADRVAGALPAGRLVMDFAVLDGTARSIRLSAGSEPGRRLLEALAGR